ncbi:MAG: hypothetical protein ACREIW_06105 [Chthoniobacterales bacterium]
MLFFRNALVGCVSLAAFGCAHITFHDPTTGDKKNVGVEYYKPKLYVLVTRTKENEYSSSIVTLPDLAQPRYALLHPGYGSNNLTLKLNNGILTEVGQQTDTKVPETITALSGLATAAAGIAKSLSAQRGGAEGEPQFWLFEIVVDQGRTKLRQVDFLK